MKNKFSSWTEKEIKQLTNLVNAGLNMNEICNLISSKTRSQIRNRISISDLKLKFEKRAWSDNEHNLLLKLAREGRPKDYIAQVLERTVSSISLRASIFQIKLTSIRTWTQDEIAKLKELVGLNMNNKQMSEILKRSRGGIQAKKQELGLCKDFTWSKDDDDILKKYYAIYGARYCYDLISTKRKISHIVSRANLIGIQRNKEWSDHDLIELKNLVEQKRSVYEISMILQKTPNSVFHKMERIGLKSKIDVLNNEFEYAPDPRFVGNFKDFMQSKIGNAKTTCKNSKLEFSIDCNFLVDIWENQNGKCFYSGRKMEIYSCAWAASIDRIDSSKGYTKDNIVLCCAIFNRMKLNYTPDRFIELCQMVSDFNQKVK